MFGSLCHSRKYLNPLDIVYLYKKQTKMAYCCHIGNGAVQCSHSSVGSVQNYLRCFVGDVLFSRLKALCHRRNVASLLLFPWRMFRRATLLSSTCSDLYSEDPQCHVYRIASAHSHRISQAIRKFMSDSFLPRTTTVSNSFPREFSPTNHYTINLCVFRIKRYLS